MFVNGWPTPAALPWSNAGSKRLGHVGSSIVRVNDTCCCWHVFKLTRSIFSPAFSAEPSLRPFWHRVLREAGAGQPFTFDLQRAFKFTSQFQPPTRQSRLYRANVDLKRRGDFFVGQAFDVAQDHCLTIRAA